MSNTNTTQGIPDVKIERFQRNLRVPLTVQEVTERAQRAAHLLGERDHKDEEQKAATKHAKAQIAEVEAELRRVSGEIRDGATYKEVGCERRHNYRLGAITEVRTDTDEVLAERAMTDRERQMDLFEKGKDGGKGKSKPKASNGSNGEPEAVGEISASFLDDDQDEAAEEETAEAGEEEDFYDQREPPLASQKPAKKKRAARKKS